MTKQKSEQFERLRELTEQLNNYSDEANRAAMAIERFLSDEIRVGVRASVLIDRDDHDEDHPRWQRTLNYGRYENQFRLFIKLIDYEDSRPDGGPSEYTTLWSNAPRNVRLDAFEKLPELLARLVDRVEARVESIRASNRAFAENLEIAPTVKKGSKK
jgi:hypothetical protein